MTASTGLHLPADRIVSALYEGILGRAADADGLQLYTRLIEEGATLEDVVQAFVSCPENEYSSVVSLGALDLAPPNAIQFGLSPQERDALWRHVARAWSQFGEDDPYYSVLTAEDYRIGNMSAEALDRFYASGEGDVVRAERYMARHGLALPRDGCCVDYGCGVGRLTLWLARRCKRVVAVDVSEAHLRIARDALAARGVTNVEFRLLRRRGDLAVLRGMDCFHSIIVLQHNPPPIVADILEHAFAGLNPGGTAFFQVPTYGLNYEWNLAQYTAAQFPLAEIEMHVVPQAAVFAAAARAGCNPLEVQPDACIGKPDWISNTFLFAKPPLGETGDEAGGIAGRLLRRLIRPFARPRPGT